MNDNNKQQRLGGLEKLSQNTEGELITKVGKNVLELTIINTGQGNETELSKIKAMGSKERGIEPLLQTSRLSFTAV